MEQYYKDSRARAEKLVGEVISGAKKSGVKARAELLDKPFSVVEDITSYARNENVDLIVLGTRGLGRFKKLLIGSVSSGVLSHAPCSVLIVR
jgi:nucleotide-binding universal stress UspA family protein